MSDIPSLPSIGILQHYSALPQREGAGVMTTLDLTIPSQLALCQNAIAGATDSLWDLEPDQVIEVSHLCAHYAAILDEETGEVAEKPIITLIGPEGIYHTGSQFAFRALQTIAWLRGAPPWNPPIKLRAVHQRSRNKRQYQSILLQE